MREKTLIVIEGATGSGKTGLAVQLAQHYGCEIISADSRQIYKGLPIGTAAPTPEELAAVPHHLVGILDLEELYSAARFETDVLDLLNRLWKTSDYAILCGGSMMYIDAVTKGIDELPTVSDRNRQRAVALYRNGGIDAIKAELGRLDPEYYRKVDLNNHKRIIHAIEVTYEAGVPYSSLLGHHRTKRPFKIVKLAIDWPRDELFERINRRVEAMIEAGLESEARIVYDKRHLNALNTVGYKELFAVFDGEMDRQTAISRIAKNTRVYAKKQLTWMKRDAEVIYLDPHSDLTTQAISHIENYTTR